MDMLTWSSCGEKSKEPFQTPESARMNNLKQSLSLKGTGRDLVEQRRDPVEGYRPRIWFEK
jgi:hypothetical protein